MEGAKGDEKENIYLKDGEELPSNRKDSPTNLKDSSINQVGTQIREDSTTVQLNLLDDSKPTTNIQDEENDSLPISYNQSQISNLEGDG